MPIPTGPSQGDGGNITIGGPDFLVLNQGQLKARADEGQGGNIRIVAEKYIPSADSLINVSSRLGVSGQVAISSSHENPATGLFLQLSDEMGREEEHFKEPCEVRAGNNMSHFTVSNREGAPTMPNDLAPSGPLWSKSKPVKTSKLMKTPAKTAPNKPASKRLAARVVNGKECSNK